MLKILILLSLSHFAGAEDNLKSATDRLVDHRRLLFINNLWGYYWHRNLYCLSETEKSRITSLMNKVRMPAVSSETTPRKDVSKAIEESSRDLGKELEKEKFSNCRNSVGTHNNQIIKENFESLHLRLLMQLENDEYWIQRNPKYTSPFGGSDLTK